MAKPGSQWHLAPWGDDEIRLTFWDSMHGEDVHIVLNTDGTASLIGYDWPLGTDIEGIVETRTPIDLIPWLRQRAQDDWRKINEDG